jgi:hypothetical protein
MEVCLKREFDFLNACSILVMSRRDALIRTGSFEKEKGLS